LLALGVRHIREALREERPDQYEVFNSLAANGIKLTAIIGSPEWAVSPEELLDLIERAVPNSVEAIEGPNEYDLRAGPNWRDALRAYQTRIYAKAKQDQFLSRLPVLGPSFGVYDGMKKMGDLGSYLDCAN